jgi:hypothetical protein
MMTWAFQVGYPTIDIIIIYLKKPQLKIHLFLRRQRSEREQQKYLTSISDDL